MGPRHVAQRERLGRAVADRREAIGLSQRDVARALRVDRSWVARLELGEDREFGADALGRLARLVQLDADELALAFGATPTWIASLLLERHDVLEQLREVRDGQQR